MVRAWRKTHRISDRNTLAGYSTIYVDMAESTTISIAGNLTAGHAEQLSAPANGRPASCKDGVGHKGPCLPHYLGRARPDRKGQHVALASGADEASSVQSDSGFP